MTEVLARTTYRPGRRLAGLLLLGLGLRLLFWQFGAAYFYGPVPGATYSNGDTFSYVGSFLNLWQHGTYILDLFPNSNFGDA